MRHDLEAGSSLELLLPPLIGNDQKGTRLIAVPNGNKVVDWAIRRVTLQTKRFHAQLFWIMKSFCGGALND